MHYRIQMDEWMDGLMDRPRTDGWTNRLSFFFHSFYPPEGGSIRDFFILVTSSNMVNTGQLRSITVN